MIQGLIPATSAFGWPTLNADRQTLTELTAEMMSDGVAYRLGSKAPNLHCEPSEIKEIDCSGFVRYALLKASGAVIPDGSVTQHEAFEEAGFKRSNPQSTLLHDNVLRIAFLPPLNNQSGHVVLVLNGLTLESHGDHGGHGGVDMRDWDSLPWIGRTAVYVVRP